MDEREQALQARIGRAPAQPAAAARRHDAPVEGEAGRRWDRPASQDHAATREEIERQLRAMWTAEQQPAAGAAPAPEPIAAPEPDPRAALLASEPIWQPEAWERPAAPPSVWSAAAPQPAAAPAPATAPAASPAAQPAWRSALDLAASAPRQPAAAPAWRPAEAAPVVEDLEVGRLRVEELRRAQEHRNAEEARFAEEIERRRILHERALEQRRLTAEAQLLEELEARRAEDGRRFADWRAEQVSRFEQELALRALEFERRLQERRAAEERALEDLRRQYELRLTQRSREEEAALGARLAALLDGFTASRESLERDVAARTTYDLAVRDGSDALRRAGEQMLREQAVVARAEERQAEPDPRIAFLPRAVSL